MDLIDIIKRDANFITKSKVVGFAQSVTIIDREGVEYVVDALHTKHHLGFDLQTAQETNTLKAHIDVSEQELTALGCQVRNADGDVYMEKFKVKAKDANGVEWTYFVSQWYPNDKFGVIVLILGRHESD